MEGRIRVFTLLCALVVTVFQFVAEAQAAPATVATAPWLDGRPALIYVAPAPAWRPDSGGPIRLVRYASVEGPRYGVLDGDAILELHGDLFSPPAPSGRVLRASEVRLLSPLSSEQVGAATVTVLEGPSAGSGFVPIELEHLDRCVAGPGDVIELPDVGTCTGRGVLVLVAARRGSLLGVTGGTLVQRETTAYLALGPWLVRGSDLVQTHGVSSQTVAAAEVALADRRRTRGDIVLIPLPRTRTEHGPGTHRWVTRAEGIGELRNTLSVGLAAG